MTPLYQTVFSSHHRRLILVPPSFRLYSSTGDGSVVTHARSCDKLAMSIILYYNIFKLFILYVLTYKVINNQLYYNNDTFVFLLRISYELFL